MSVLEQDCVLGSFSHTDKYIGTLKKSVDKFLPNIQFLTYIGDGPVNINMTHMQDEFMKTEKRYFCYLDHDISFLNSDIIKNALTTLISNKAGLCTVYSSHNPEYLTKPYYSAELLVGIIPWSVGYFMMIDREKVGYIKPDLGLPDPCYGIDVDYSIQVRKAGYDVVVSNDYIYHLNKGKQDDSFAEVTREYFIKKYGQFYLNCYQTVSLNLA